jgi:hypothetical protein
VPYLLAQQKALPAFPSVVQSQATCMQPSHRAIYCSKSHCLKGCSWALHCCCHCLPVLCRPACCSTPPCVTPATQCPGAPAEGGAATRHHQPPASHHSQTWCSSSGSKQRRCSRMSSQAHSSCGVKGHAHSPSCCSSHVHTCPRQLPTMPCCSCPVALGCCVLMFASPASA